jgi:hypothetical protein
MGISLYEPCSVNSPRREVLVKAGRPKVWQHERLYCPVQIERISDESVHHIFGVDAFDGVQLALTFIGYVLRGWSEQQSRTLSWESDEGVSFPSIPGN